MKKILFFALMICPFAMAFSQTITVHNRTHLSTKGEYSKRVLFPIEDKNLNYIKMDLHLNCPEGGCSDWDYSINILLRTIKNGDTVNYQLGRMITPYSGAYNQGNNAKSWDHVWSWEITEYLPLMKDSVDIVLCYEGYQDGFLATTDFIFNSIKATDVKRDDFLDVKNVYFGYFPYGKDKDEIDNYVKEKTITLPKGTKSVLGRVTVSGHGGDSLNAAAEFLEKSYYYKVNGNTIATQPIWKNDCGCNPIKPQGGTWIYNRAGWCPGSKVNEYYYDLTPYVKDNKLKIDMDFEYYNGHSSGEAGYQIANDVFFIRKKDYNSKRIRNEVVTDTDYIVMNYNSQNLSSKESKKYNIVWKTNNDARNKWYIKDLNSNKKVYERSQMEPNTEYCQMVELADSLTYKFIFQDNDCDGLAWWANKAQGDGYVLIYNEDKTEILEAFDPDFGCKIDYTFNNKSLSDKAFAHNKTLVTFSDSKDSTYHFIFFASQNNDNDMKIEIINRKTKDTIFSKTYPATSTFNISISTKDFANGYYKATVSCGTFQENRMVIIDNKQEER